MENEGKLIITYTGFVKEVKARQELQCYEGGKEGRKEGRKDQNTVMYLIGYRWFDCIIKRNKTS